MQQEFEGAREGTQTLPAKRNFLHLASMITRLWKTQAISYALLILTLSAQPLKRTQFPVLGLIIFQITP